MAKASEPKKPAAKASPAKKATAKSAGGETPVSSKEVPTPPKSKTGNTAATRPTAIAGRRWDW